MLYTKSLGDIHFSDIKTFISEQHRENEILDYKEAWPKDLEKVIAAMANTQGGLIMIGVSEKGKTGLPDRIVGVMVDRGIDALRQRVVNVSYQAIYPPIIPEVECYEIDNEPGRVIVLIRVAQSDQTPHAVDDRRMVYVRVDSQSYPHRYRLARIDELEWLLERRLKGEKYLITLEEAAQSRAADALSVESALPTVESELPTIQACISPRFYVGTEVFSRLTTKSLLTNKSVTTSMMNKKWGFPYRTGGERSIPLGYCLYTKKFRQKEPGIHFYLELNTNGVLFFRARVLLANIADWKQILPFETLCELEGILKYASVVYKEGHLWGLIRIHASLTGLKNVVLRVNPDYPYDELSENHTSLDTNVSLLDKTIDVSALGSSRSELMKEATRELLWAFGYAQSDDEFTALWNDVWVEAPDEI